MSTLGRHAVKLTRQSERPLSACLMWLLFFCRMIREYEHSRGVSLACLSPPLGRISFANFMCFASKSLKKDKNDHH